MPADDPRDEPVIIASMGRSGSTLVLRLLNLAPDLTIWGEHGGFLIDFMSAIDRVQSAGPLVGGRKRRDAVIGPLRDTDAFIPWVSPFGPNEFRNQTRMFIRRLFTRPLPDGTRWGFKEIRYRAEHLRGLRQLFPGARFVIVVRGAREQIISRTQAFNEPGQLISVDGEQDQPRIIRAAADQWVARHEGYLAFVEDFPNQTLVLTYESARSPAFDAPPIFDFVDVAMPPQAEIDDVFSKRAGSKDAQATTEWTPELKDQLVSLVHSVDLGYDVDALFERFRQLETKTSDVPASPHGEGGASGNRVS